MLSMNQIEGEGNPRFITALTAEQVDWSLFDDPDFSKELIKMYAYLYDFGKEILDIRKQFTEKDAHEYYQSLGHVESLAPEVYISPELEFFLEQNRPQTLFFAPADIKSLLTADSDITCNYEETEELETWQFRLNPQKYQEDKQTITLNRGKMNKNVDDQETYLVITFPVRYDDPNAIFYPHIPYMNIYGDNIPGDKLTKEMMKLLGLQQHRMEQQLDFRVKKQELRKMLVDAENIIDTSNLSSIEELPYTDKWDVYPVEISLRTTP